MRSWRSEHKVRGGERVKDLLFQSRHLHLGKWRLFEQFIAHTIIQKSANGACDVMLILAGKTAAVEFYQVAADVMRGDILDGFKAIGLAPADEKREF